MKQRENTALLTHWTLANFRASAFEPLKLFSETQALKRELPPNNAELAFLLEYKLKRTKK